MSKPAFGIAITADDKTARGAASAEKRLGRIPKYASAVNRRALADDERRIGAHRRSIIRTFGAVEQASARAFGGRSLTAPIAERLGAIRAAGAAAGTGLGEAAAGGGMLTSALGGLGVVAGATVGILAAAGYAAFKLTDGWAKGAAQVGRTADMIGVARKEMQEFSAAAERMGVDRSAATGGLGGLSQTLNDARYGRNRDALAVLTKLGIKLRTNPDGTVDVAAMLPAIADAMKRQNSSGRRTMARILGVGDALIPTLAQGGDKLAADMTDAGKVAYIVSDDDVTRGQRIERKGATVGQMKDKAMGMAGSEAANLAEPGYDAVIAGGTRALSGATSFGGVVRNVFSPGAAKVDKGGAAVERGGRAIERAAGRLTLGQVRAKARQGVRLRADLMALGADENKATAMAANGVMESGGNHRAREKGGNGVGIFQITDRARKELFRRKMGVGVDEASRKQHLQFALWELEHSEKRNWARAQRNGGSAENLAAGYARYVERPANKDRDSAERAAVAAAMTNIPVHVTVEMRGAPPGTKATATAAGRGGKPSISYAYSGSR